MMNEKSISISSFLHRGKIVSWYLGRIIKAYALVAQDTQKIEAIEHFSIDNQTDYLLREMMANTVQKVNKMRENFWLHISFLRQY